MTLAAGQVDAESDRLERFRGLRTRLDPAGDPERALAEGLYVRPERSVSARIAAELAISPASMHLLIGGVGSGKTTELLAAQGQLNQIQDSRALYIDVSKRHDIAHMPPGAVAVQVGLGLSELVQALGASDDEQGLAQRIKWLRNMAYGYWEDPIFLNNEDDGDLIRVDGLLVPPDQLQKDVKDVSGHMQPLLDALRAKWRHVLVLLDGLDRMTDMAAFEQLIEHDIKALTSIGVGVVLVGPLRALYGIDRAVTQRFDGFHYQPWIDLASSPEADAFLTNVLRRRVPEDAINAQGIAALVHHSGGVLRDLLALAQSACVEAYLDGSDVIGLVQADLAIDSFGRKHMQGLRPAEIEVLQRVLAKGTFVHTSEDDLALLMTRRVLEYRNNGRPRYAVHPTIERFLGEMADK